MTMVKKQAHVFFRYWFPVFLYCLAIFVQSSYPRPEALSLFLLSDKLLHGVAYALLGMFFLRALRNSVGGYGQGLVFVLAIFLTGTYGATDELHQHFVPARTADWWDLFADFVGGCFGVAFYQFLLKRKPDLQRL